MKDFYQEASYGQLDVTGGSAGVTGWETADHGHDYYGQSTQNAAELAREAVRKADDRMDFSEYDNNNDGVVDGVIVIHQGPGQESTGDSTDIWSHRFSFTGAGLNAYRTNDGVYVNPYSLQPETVYNGITTIGVVAHETGHLFGLPDLYDTDDSSEGIGDWGLMGGGSWNGLNRPGDSPAHPIAYNKWQQGWITPTEKPRTGEMGVLEPYASTASTFRWLDNPNGVEIGGTGEYFLASNRQQTGFDRALPGEGMLITHIDETQSSNQDESHKLVDVEAADGDQDMDASRNRGDPGDPFPGWTNAQAFNSTTTPNSILYDGSPSGLTINDLYVDGDRIALNPSPSAKVTPKPLDFGTIRYTSNASLNVTVTNDGTEPLNVTNASIVGGDVRHFNISAGGGQQVLTPGASTEVGITFEPSNRSSYSATLRLEHNASGSPSEISLTGVGGAPDYDVTPASTVDFGNVSVEDGRAQADIVVENNGTLPLNVSNASITGRNASNFSIATGSTTLPSTIQTGSAATYTINLSVDSLGNRTAMIEFENDVPDRGPINLTLTGTGVDRNPPNIRHGRALSSTGIPTAGPNASVTIAANVSDAIGVQNVTANASVLGAGTVTLTDENADSVYNTTVSVDVANATEGVHELIIKSVDTSGHSSTNKTQPLTVDLSAPNLTITTPDEDWVQNATNLTVSGDVSDNLTSVASVEIRHDGGAWSEANVTAGSWTHTVSGLDEGEHTVSVRATDNVSNVAPIVARNVTVDLTAPVITNASLNKTADILPETSLAVSVTANDTLSRVSTVTAGGATLRINSGTWNGTTTTASSIGPATVTAIVVDAAGNQNTTTLNYDVGRNATLHEVNNSTYRATPSSTPVISAVSMNTTTNVSGQQVTVGTAITNPTETTAKNDTALYFPQVNTTVANANISNATVALQLSKQRFADQYVHANSTTFWVLENGTWTQANATLQNETATAYVYDLHTTHFSTFAVTGDTENTPPSITPLRPANNSETTDRTPTIEASYNDTFSGVNVSSVTLSIDGRKISTGLSVTANRVTYTPQSDLATGSRTITVTVADNASNVQSKQWTFTINEPTTGGGSSGGGGGQLSNPFPTTESPTIQPTTTEPEQTATTEPPETPDATTAAPTTQTPSSTTNHNTTRGSSETSETIPGFGVTTALVAVLSAALLALRRKL